MRARRRRDGGFGEAEGAVGGMAAIVPLLIAFSFVVPKVQPLGERTTNVVLVLGMAAALEAAFAGWITRSPLLGLAISLIVLVGGGAGALVARALGSEPAAQVIAGGIGAVLALPVLAGFLFVKNTIAEKLTPKPPADV